VADAFGNAIGQSIVGQMMATEGEKRTAQIASNLAQETQQANSQINSDFARSQQEFSDQIASQFDASVSRDLDQFAAQQTERSIIGAAEAGFNTPRIQALAIPTSVQAAINDAAALNITQTSGGFDFKSASMALRQQQDTAKRSAVQSAVESGNYSEAVRLASESLRANDPIGYALANQTQDAPSAVTRALGGLRLVGGAIDVGIGTALSATGVGAYVGVPLAAYGADQYVTGSRSLVTGLGADSAFVQAGEYAGLSPFAAQALELVTGLGLNVGGTAASAARVSSRTGTESLLDLSSVTDISPGLYRVDPTQLRFSQHVASPNFSSGGTISDLVAELRAGKSVDDVRGGPLRVIIEDGKAFSLDNRRLVAFNAARVESVPIQVLSRSDETVSTLLRNPTRFAPIAGEGQYIAIAPAAEQSAAWQLLRQNGLIR